MRIDRLDLDGVGSPAGLAARIHQLLPDLPSRVPVEELCRQLDIVSIEEVATDGFEAALVMDTLKASGPILVASGRPPQRRRFSIAHELGHFLIPSHRPEKDHPFQCSFGDLNLLDARSRDRQKRIEAEANRFAANLLMPPNRIRAAIGGVATSLEGIVALAREFEVSKEAMARAWVDAYRAPVAVIVAHAGRVLRQYRSDDFPWLPDRRGQRLPYGSPAASALPPVGIYWPIEEIEPDLWLAERDLARTLVLTEQVLGQRDGYALILLQAELGED